MLISAQAHMAIRYLFVSLYQELFC